MADNIFLYDTFDEYAANETDFPGYKCFSGLNYYEVEYESDYETDEITGVTSGFICHNIIIMDSGEQTTRAFLINKILRPEWTWDEQTDEEYMTGWIPDVGSNFQILQFNEPLELSSGFSYYIPNNVSGYTSPAYMIPVQRMWTSGGVETYDIEQNQSYAKFNIFYVSGDTANTKYYALSEVGGHFPNPEDETPSSIYGEFTYVYDYDTLTGGSLEYWDVPNGKKSIGSLFTVGGFFPLNPESLEAKPLFSPFYKGFQYLHSGYTYIEPTNPYLSYYSISNRATNWSVENVGNGWRFKTIDGMEVPEASAVTYGWDKYVCANVNYDNWPDWSIDDKVFYKKDDTMERHVSSANWSNNGYIRDMYNNLFYEEGDTSGKIYYGGPSIYTDYNYYKSNNVITASTAYTETYPTQMYEISEGKFTRGTEAGLKAYPGVLHFTPKMLPSNNVINSVVPGVCVVDSGLTEPKVFYNRPPLNLTFELYYGNNGGWELASSRKFKNYTVSAENLMVPIIEHYGTIQNVPGEFKFELIDAYGNKIYGGEHQELSDWTNWINYYDTPAKMIPVEIYDAVAGKFSPFLTFLNGATIRMYFDWRIL